MTVQARADIDARATSLATQALSGELDERIVRSELAELLFQSGIAAEVATYPNNLGHQAIVDVTEAVSAKLTDWVIDPASTFFDLARVSQGSSLCGWARQSGQLVAKRHEAVRPRGLAFATSLVDPTPVAGEADGSLIVTTGTGARVDFVARQYHLHQAFGGASAEDLALAEAHIDDEPSYSTEIMVATRGQRPESRPFAISATLRRCLNLPPLCVPHDDADRQYLIERCTSDPLLASRSWRAVIDILEDPSPRRSSTDERLLSLWDDYSLEHLHALDRHPPEAINAVVLGALTPAPKLSRLAMRTMVRLVKDKNPSSTRPWLTLANRVVASYVARHTKAVSEFDDTNDEATKAAMRRAAQADALAWPKVLAEVIAFPGTPLGADAMTVEDELASAMSLSWDADAAARGRRAHASTQTPTSGSAAVALADRSRDHAEPLVAVGH